MIRYIRRVGYGRGYTYPYIRKTNIVYIPKILYKSDLQRDKAIIDKVIEDNDEIYDKINNNSLDNYYRYNYMIKMLQKKNKELQIENEMLKQEKDELFIKNQELKEFLKDKLN
jgi:hypothetical protein